MRGREASIPHSIVVVILPFPSVAGYKCRRSRACYAWSSSLELYLRHPE